MNVECIRYFLDMIGRIEDAATNNAIDARHGIPCQPRSAVGCILSWSYPLMTPARKLLPGARRRQQHEARSRRAVAAVGEPA